MIKSNLLG